MNITLDTSPVQDLASVSHRARGVGFYIQNLQKALLEYYPHNSYSFFVRGERLPKDTDIVHYPYFEPFFLTLPLLKRTKTVVTVHDLTPLVFPNFFPSGIKGRIKWEIQKKALQSCDYIIADSECSKKDIIKYAGISEEKVEVVYLAAGEEFVRKSLNRGEKERLMEKYNLEEKFALYVGDVTWNKNLPRLLDAAQKAGIFLAMVGKALTSKDYDKNNPWNRDLSIVQKRLENNENVKFLGFVEDDDLVSLYNLAKLSVMPSLYEGFGLPILEAMRCGCPVVTTKEGSIPEVAGDAAVFVDAYDSDDIARGLREIYQSKNLQKKLSTMGMHWANKFSWKKTADETVAVYEKSLKQ